MPRPGPAVIFLEEVVEGQLPDGPVVRSSCVLDCGPRGVPPPCLPSSSGRTRSALGKDGANVLGRTC